MSNITRALLSFFILAQAQRTPSRLPLLAYAPGAEFLKVSETGFVELHLLGNETAVPQAPVHRRGSRRRSTSVALSQQRRQPVAAAQCVVPAGTRISCGPIITVEECDKHSCCFDDTATTTKCFQPAVTKGTAVFVGDQACRDGANELQAMLQALHKTSESLAGTMAADLQSASASLEATFQTRAHIDKLIRDRDEAISKCSTDEASVVEQYSVLRTELEELKQIAWLVEGADDLASIDLDQLGQLSFVQKNMKIFKAGKKSRAAQRQTVWRLADSMLECMDRATEIDAHGNVRQNGDCDGARQRLEEAYAKAYVKTSSMITHFGNSLHDTSCYESAQSEYTSLRAAADGRSTEASEKVVVALSALSTSRSSAQTLATDNLAISAKVATLKPICVRVENEDVISQYLTAVDAVTTEMLVQSEAEKWMGARETYSATSR